MNVEDMPQQSREQSPMPTVEEVVALLPPNLVRDPVREITRFMKNPKHVQGKTAQEIATNFYHTVTTTI